MKTFKKHTLSFAVLSAIAMANTNTYADEFFTDDLFITDNTPAVKFDDSSRASGTAEYNIAVTSATPTGNNIGQFIISEGAAFDAIFRIANPLTLGSRINSIEVMNDGDVRFVNDDAVITKSGNGPRLGIGTVAPSTTAHFYQEAIDPPGSAFTPIDATITLEAQDTSSTTNKWVVEADANTNSMYFRSQTVGANAAVMQLQDNRVRIIQDVLAQGDLDVSGDADIDGDTNVDGKLETDGLIAGTGTPDPTLLPHVAHIRDNSKDMLLLENTSGSSNIRRLLKMYNNGPVGFEMTDRGNPVTWQFRSGNSGAFLINNQATTGSELTITKNDGNMIVKGSVTANGILLTSSKHSKTDIKPIKASDFMEKLKKVEIAEWRYKKADKNDRHISPMAEDFYSLFQLGPDDKHINPNDLASVAIVAAKELQTETAELKLENAKLQARLASLEKLVTNLASSGNLLPEAGDNVVLLKK